jgi:TolB-like protein
MKRVFLCLAVIGMIFSASASYAENLRIVVMDLKADGVSDQIARTVSNMLRTEFINMNEFTVVERAQMDAILKEQGVQQSGCTDQACAVQMGRLMSARKILVGEVSPMGKSIITTVRIVDVEKGVSEFAATQKAASEEVLDVAVGDIAEKLADRIRKGSKDEPKKENKKAVVREAEPEAPGEITPAGYFLRGIVPGWGQFYSGHNIKGWIFGGVFVATLAGTIVSVNKYNTAKKEYEDLGPGLPQSEYDSKFDAYKSAGGGAKLFLILFSAGYIVNWVDIAFFSRPDFSGQANLMNFDRDTQFTFNSYNKSYPYKETAFDAGMSLRF